MKLTNTRLSDFASTLKRKILVSTSTAYITSRWTETKIDVRIFIFLTQYFIWVGFGEVLKARIGMFI